MEGPLKLGMLTEGAEMRGPLSEGEGVEMFRPGKDEPPDAEGGGAWGWP